MSIQKCKNCGTEFKYKTLMKGLWDFSTECNNCGTSHKVTVSSRVVFSILLVTPPFLNTLFDFSVFSKPMLKTLVYLVYAIIILAMSPSIYRYKLKDSNKSNK